MLTFDTPAEPVDRAAPAPTATSRIEVASVVVVGAALAVAVAADGDLLWRVLRPLVVILLCLAMVDVTRRRTVGAALGLLAWSALGIVLGVAFGVRWLVVDGVSVRAVTGLGALAAGGVLLVFAVRRLVSGRSSWRRFGRGFAAVLAVVVLVWTVTPAVMATNMPPIRPGELTPDEVGLDAELVRFTSADGVELAAWYVPSRNGAAVVLRHGASSTSSAVLEHAAVLASHGYGVLATDARGHGRSAGRAMDFGWYGDLDTSAAVDYLTWQPDVDPSRIAVMGLSMGGEEAIGAAGSDRRIRAVVAEGATARTYDDLEWLVDAYGARGVLQRAFDAVRFVVTDALTDASPPMSLDDAVRAAGPRPVLLVTAGDVVDEQHAAEHLVAASPGTVEVWHVAGAGHTDGLDVAPAEWEERVVGFLDRVLAAD